MPDLCVSAALDSIKEHLQLPWSSRHNAAAPAPPLTALLSTEVGPSDGLKDVSETPKVAIENPPRTDKTDVVESLDRHSENKTPSEVASNPETPKDLEGPDASRKRRTLHLHNFTQALKEITPSSSESLGSLADLRKWNEEFGEGRKDRKKRQVWGKGRFGFVNEDKDQTVGDGRVAKE